MVNTIKNDNQELEKFEEMMAKGFEKFKKCRTEASQNSAKKAKTIPLNVNILLFRFITDSLQA